MWETIKTVGIAIFTLSGLGFLFGIGLAVIAKVFHVETDPRIATMERDILPGINCGACGYPGCSGYADAIIMNNTEINLCAPGGEVVIDKISALLGVNAEAKLKNVAKVFCLGDDAVALKDYEFNGDEDCSTVATYFNGERACKYGCVGRGDCIRICPVDAIKRDSLNRVWVDAHLCIGCEKCIAVCPTNVIHMIPKNGEYFVACSSPEAGKIVRKICKKGCIACKICEKASGGVERIEVIDFLAHVKYESDIDLHQAAVKCPADVIVPIINQTLFMKDNKKNKDEKKTV